MDIYIHENDTYMDTNDKHHGFPSQTITFPEDTPPIWGYTSTFLEIIFWKAFPHGFSVIFLAPALAIEPHLIEDTLGRW